MTFSGATSSKFDYISESSGTCMRRWTPKRHPGLTESESHSFPCSPTSGGRGAARIRKVHTPNHSDDRIGETALGESLIYGVTWKHSSCHSQKRAVIGISLLHGLYFLWGQYVSSTIKGHYFRWIERTVWMWGFWKLKWVKGTSLVMFSPLGFIFWVILSWNCLPALGNWAELSPPSWVTNIQGPSEIPSKIHKMDPQNKREAFSPLVVGLLPSLQLLLLMLLDKVSL